MTIGTGKVNAYFIYLSGCCTRFIHDGAGGDIGGCTERGLQKDRSIRVGQATVVRTPTCKQEGAKDEQVKD
jgi:hypothetical protein